MDKPKFLRAVLRAAARSAWLGGLALALAACENPVAKEFKPEQKPPPNKNAPTISAIGNVTIAQDASAAVDFAVRDPDGPLSCQGSVFVSTSDTSLLPPTHVVKTGQAPDCRLQLTPASGHFGAATVRVEVSDGSSSAYSSFTLTVTEGDPAAVVANAAANEGGAVSFVVQLTHASPVPKTVTYATADGTAVAGTHYASTAGTLVFAPGQTSKTIAVPTVHDNIHAPDRAFGISVTSAGVTTAATGTILNTDAAPTASAADVAANEGGALIFTVNLNRASTGNVSVGYATANGTAAAGTNYTAAAGTLTFLPGETAKTIAVASLADGVYSPHLDFSLGLTANGTTHTATGTINNTDPPPTAAAANVSANEGSPLVFTVNLDRAATTATTVSYATANGTAAAGTNYTATSGTLTFAAGQTSKTITVASAGDNVHTGNLDFTLSLTANGTTHTATGTVVNIDSAPVATVANAAANEGNSLTFTVNLNRSSAGATSVAYSTTDGTAVAGANYATVSGTLIFNAGETAKTVSVSTIHDNVHTPNLGFTFGVTANGTTNTATGTVNNTDAAPTASAADAAAGEGSTLTFTVSLNRASSSATSVTYSTADGTAVAGTNYTAASGTLTFNAGETAKTVSVTTADDGVYTPDLAFTFGTTANGTTNVATGTIVNAQAPPVASVSDASANEGASLTFTVTLDHAASSATNVAYATADGTALAGTNYAAAAGTLTFAAGQTTKSVTVTSLADSTHSPNLNFTLSATANGATSSGTGTIVNTDAVPTVSVSSGGSVTEGGGATFTFTLDHASASAVQVDYATVNGTATSGGDYTAASGTATIGAGSLSTSVTVATADDDADEQDESFSVQISNPVNAALGAGSASVTIQDTALYFSFLGGSLPSGLTFSRAGSATYFDASGVMRTAAAGTPRFDHDPSSCAGSCPPRGLLIEESRTNLLLQSAAFGATWAANGVTVADNAAASPNGGANAEAVASGTSGSANSDRIEQSVTVAANTPYVLSFFVKNSTSSQSRFELNAPNSGTAGKAATITWAGAVPALSSGTATALPDGWYRVQLPLTTGAADAGTATVAFYPADSAADSLGEVYLWGAQLEAGATASSYIATAASAATRAADSLAVDNFGVWFNPSAWTAILDFSRPEYEAASSGATPTLFSACDDTSGASCAADRFEAIYSPGDDTFRGRSWVSASNVATSAYANGAGLAGATVQLAVSQTPNGELQTAVNGTAAAASGAAGKPSLHAFAIGSGGRAGAYGNQLNGHLKKFTYRARALTASQLQALTSD